MCKTTTIFRRLATCCSFALLSAILLMGSAQAQNVGNRNAGTGVMPKAVSNTAYTFSTTLHGLQAANSTQNFSVTAHGICRYLDVGNAPGGQGILIPFATAAEWLRGNGVANTGFIATSASRSFVKLDFCRPQTTQTAEFTGAGGISAPANLVAGQPTTKSYTFSQVRIDTRGNDVQFAQSLTEQRSEDFSLTRADCLGNITYPDGSVRNPCFTWSWVEQITATFVDSIGKVRTEAAVAASASPVQAGTNNWSNTLSRSACVGPNGVASDGRPVVGATCPPAVTPPVLRACLPQNHNSKHWETVSTGNVRDLHDCGPGYIEDPARRFTFDGQAEYWCFDGTDYPTGATREINGVISGMCKPIINAVVGPMNGQSVPSLTVNSGGLCSVGAVVNFTTTNTGWTWTCQGINTGADVNGSANHSANLQFTCGAGGLGGNGTITSACTRYNSNNGTCEGTNTWTGVSGCCVPNQVYTQNFNVNGFTLQGCDLPADGAWANGACAGTNITNGLNCEAGELTETPVTCAVGERLQTKTKTFACTGINPFRQSGIQARCVADTSCVPVCTPGTETRTSTQCPAGQSGTITEQRDTNVGTTCGAYGNWNVTGNTCTNICNQSTETRTSTACPAGQAGMITEQRSTNIGNTCGNNGNWNVTGNTCTPVYTYGWDAGPWTPGVCDAPPTCTQGVESRNSTACPVGQTGTITEQRTTNTGGSCGTYGNWVVSSNTCAAPTCTPGTETRTSTACPAGQTGVITEQRNTNAGNVCGAYGNWNVIGNTCAASTGCPGNVTPTPGTCHVVSTHWQDSDNIGSSVVATLTTGQTYTEAGAGGYGWSQNSRSTAQPDKSWSIACSSSNFGGEYPGDRGDTACSFVNNPASGGDNVVVTCSAPTTCPSQAATQWTGFFIDLYNSYQAPQAYVTSMVEGSGNAPTNGNYCPSRGFTSYQGDFFPGWGQYPQYDSAGISDIHTTIGSVAAEVCYELYWSPDSIDGAGFHRVKWYTKP